MYSYKVEVTFGVSILHRYVTTHSIDSFCPSLLLVENAVYVQYILGIQMVPLDCDC